MYDITKTRMLLTTAVFAAVAAMLAGGANARALAEDGSVDPGMCAALDLEQLRGVLIDEHAIKAATPGAIQQCSVAESVAQAPQGSGTFPVDPELCAALDLEQLRGVLIDEHAIKAATPGAIQACSHARAAKSIAPVLASSEVYVNNRKGTTQKRVARPRPNRFPDGRRSSP